jgi:hypothetical protein
MSFKGCSAIVTGKNNSGKTSFLKGIIDRIRFIRPEVMVKAGEKEGKGDLVLDSGEKFIWNFNTDGVDKLTYLTTQGRQSVSKDLGSQFFPPVFDIDKFLQSSPKQQVKQLQAIVGIDFEEIDKRYLDAYNHRTERNREAEIYHVKLEKMMRVDYVQSVDLTELKEKKENERGLLNALYQANKVKNEEARKLWDIAKQEVNKTCSTFNALQQKRKLDFDDCMAAADILLAHGYDGQEIGKFLRSKSDLIQPDMVATELYPKEPTYIEEMPDRTELDKIDALIETAAGINAQAQKYKEYVDYKTETENAREAADEADLAVKEIENERKKMIESAKFPEGISITPDGILVDGFPLDKNQISTSKLYCAALRIASMGLGEVRTLYFDASFLDKITLAEIQKWAEENLLQLLIERPDYDGGEIKYELIEG